MNETMPIEEERDTRERLVRLYGPVDEGTCLRVVEEILSLDYASDEPILLYISSPGGSVLHGLAVVDAMRYARSEVHTYAIGLAASMAAIILACGERGRRYALPHCQILLHPTRGQAFGRSEDIKATLGMQRDCDRQLRRLLVEATGASSACIGRYLRGENFLSPTRARELGVIDEILEPEAI